METTLPTCYRHPDRETRLACSSCDRPVCTDCMRSAPVGQKCLECARPEGRNRVITADQIRAGGGATSAPVTFTIIGVAVALFVLGFVGPLADVLYGYLAQSNVLVAEGQWWRVITAAFLHAPGSLLHIGFNMYALYVFGAPLERQVGSVAFGLLYFASALAGGAAYLVMGPPGGIAVGASGAVFGLFGAWLAAAVRSRHTIAGQANLRQLGVLLAINLALPLIAPSIAWQAHLGGLAAGFLVALAWGAGHGRQAARVSAPALVAVLALAVVLAA